MKVFITGATGVLGRRLVRRFREHGHEVAALARTQEAAAVLLELGAEPHTVDIFDADALARAAEGCQSLVHAATSIPKGPRPRLSDFAENDRLRLEGTRAMSQA